MTSFSLTCIETRDIDKAVAAVSSSLRCFPATTLYWLGTESFPLALPGVSIVNIRIEPFTDFREDINHLCLKFLPQLINTDYNLHVQHDGYAVHREAWTDDFLLYDYIGASWPWFWNGGPYWDKPIVGNGGFSLRSRRLYQALAQIGIEWSAQRWEQDPRWQEAFYTTTGVDGVKWIPEDLLICLWYRSQLEKDFGIRFAPPELANRFSVETSHPFTEYWVGKSFGFHNWEMAPLYGAAS